MSSLQDIAVGLIAVFHKYSQKEGDKYTLTKAELKTLLETELDDLLSTSNNPEGVDEAMKKLDMNQDGVVDFKEFMVMFAVLTMCCHEFFKDDQSSNN